MLDEIVIEPKKLVGLDHNTAWLRAGGAPVEIGEDRKLHPLLLPPHENYVIDNEDDARDIVLLADCYRPNMKFQMAKTLMLRRCMLQATRGHS